MNTPAHLIFGVAAFGRPERSGTTAAALGGALLPDLSLYLMAGASIALLGVPPATVFREYYYSDAWQTVFAIDNSVLLWAAGMAAALWLRSGLGVAFAGAGLLHLALDFTLHHDDARRHFWPLSDWVFQSPVSYWDHRHYGGIAGSVEIAATLVLVAVLVRRHRSLAWRAMFVALAVLETLPAVMWRLMF